MTNTGTLSGTGPTEIITFTCYLENIMAGQDFKLRCFMILDTYKFKGLVFNIANNPPDDALLLDAVAGPGDSLTLDAVISNYELKWAAEQKVRVMYFNERDPEEFVRAKPYFLERLACFGDSETTSEDDYNDFTKEWNKRNTGNLMYVEPEPETLNETGKISIPKQTKKDDILTIH